MLQAAIPPLALPTGDGDGSGEHVGDAQDAWARRYVELTPSAMLLYARASTESKFTRIQVWRWEDVALVELAWGGNNRTHRASSKSVSLQRWVRNMFCTLLLCDHPCVHASSNRRANKLRIQVGTLYETTTKKVASASMPQTSDVSYQHPHLNS